MSLTAIVLSRPLAIGTPPLHERFVGLLVGVFARRFLLFLTSTPHGPGNYGRILGGFSCYQRLCVFGRMGGFGRGRFNPGKHGCAARSVSCL